MHIQKEKCMEKLDLRKQYKHLYQPSAKKVEVVDVPAFKFALIDGEIEPGQAPGTSPSFAEALQALYGISYTLKFMSKLRKEEPLDYSVMALEGLWWIRSADGEHPPEFLEADLAHPENWCWTAMVMQPDHISEAMYQEGLAQLRKKKPSPALDKMRFETFQEGLCIQILHIGPYADEPATIQKMDAFAQEKGYRLCGKHHEIYLGDPRRADPAKLKTVLRHPVEIIAPSQGG
jgi:hypothetical protein